MDASAHDLKGLTKRVADNGLALADPGAFDIAFSALHSFARLDPSAQEATAILLVGAIARDESGRRATSDERDADLSAGTVQAALKACKRAVQTHASDQEGVLCCAVLKAAVYLLSWLVQEAEKALAEKAAAASTQRKVGGKGKQSAATFDWEAYRAQAALRLQEVLDVRAAPAECFSPALPLARSVPWSWPRRRRHAPRVDAPALTLTAGA